VPYLAAECSSKAGWARELQWPWAHLLHPTPSRHHAVIQSSPGASACQRTLQSSCAASFIVRSSVPLMIASRCAEPIRSAGQVAPHVKVALVRCRASANYSIRKSPASELFLHVVPEKWSTN
jgi:hypothetical protein